MQIEREIFIYNYDLFIYIIHITDNEVSQRITPIRVINKISECSDPIPRFAWKFKYDTNTNIAGRETSKRTISVAAK